MEKVLLTETNVAAPLSQPSVEKTEPVKPIKKAPPVKPRPLPVIEKTNESASSFSGKLADTADLLDSFQGKMKGYFNKKK